MEKRKTLSKTKVFEIQKLMVKLKFEVDRCGEDDKIEMMV